MFQVIEILSGVGHCFAWHVQVNFGFYFNFKIEELVHSGLCAMWHLEHNSILTFSRIKILWKINKNICLATGDNQSENYIPELFIQGRQKNKSSPEIFPADRIRVLPWKINRLLLHFWLLEITQGRIKFWNYLLQAEKRISHI
jgi:hypothetical protein